MLQTVDVLIGFSMVMLVLSVVVTMLVQVVVSMLLNLKGRVLKEGVAHLLNLLDKDNLSADETRKIAHHLLTNTLVARKRVFGGFFGKEFALAQTIHREELIKLVLDFAGNGDLDKASALAKEENRSKQLEKKKSDSQLTAEEELELDGHSQRIADIGLKGEGLLRARLLNSLRDNGIVGDPKEIVKSIRNTMLILEKERPEIASDVRQTMATVRHAQSEFVAKVNGWFDQTIDRTVESYTGKTRAWTTLFAAVVALFFQVDTFELIQRLSVDKETRQMLVVAATSKPEQFQALAKIQRQLAEEEESAAKKAKDAADTRVKAAPDAEAHDALTAAQARLDKATTALAALPPLRDPRKQAQADLDAAQSQLSAAGNESAKAAARKAVMDAKKRLEAPEAAPFSQSDALAAIENNPDLKKLIDADLISKPTSREEWLKAWPDSFFGWLARTVGIAVMIGLLTLGAPVWYEILKNLIQFRSLVARKDDVIRATRQTSQKPAG